MSKLVEWFKGLSVTSQRLIIAIPVVIALYYIMSPYQNCVRGEGYPSEAWCIRNTSW